MFDGSFKYKGGEATYEGEFLGINYETMVAKLAALGMTNNKAIKDVPMGLSAFINHSGQKWVTYSITEINFVTE